MSATEYKQYTLECDQGDSPATACREVFRGKGNEARAAVRGRARRGGWTQVRSDAGRYYDEDYCPAHKPEGS